MRSQYVHYMESMRADNRSMVDMCTMTDAHNVHKQTACSMHGANTPRDITYHGTLSTLPTTLYA